MPDAPVVLWSFPRVFGQPSASPFCTKLENWLVLARIPYTVKRPSGPPRSRTGKLPAIERPDGSLLADSQVIIETLAAERSIDVAPGLTPEQHAVGLMLRRTVEEHLYWGIVHERWADPAGWPEYRKVLFGRLGPPLSWIVPRLARSKALSGLHGHGLGRVDDAAREAMLRDDVAAIAALLGTDAWFFGAADPTLYDVVVHACTASILATSFPTPLQAIVREHPTLVAHAARLDHALAAARAEASG